jgi:hypothetical protein
MRLKVKLGCYSYHNNETFIVKGSFMCAVMFILIFILVKLTHKSAVIL